MSVWPEPQAALKPSLTSAEGELVSASISVEPWQLEQLLEALSEAPFPINPRIFHSASTTRVYPDGCEEVEPATVVEFPAYSGRIPGLRDLLRRRGFDPNALWAENLLEEIHTGAFSSPAPPGSPCIRIVRRLCAAAPA